VFRRRFRKLEIDGGAGAARAPEEITGPAAPVFHRNLELDGETDRDFGASEQPSARAKPFEETETAQETLAPNPAPAPTSTPVDARSEPGFGTVLAAGALAACIFALVSIPVRAAFAAAFREGGAWRGASEILVVVALTLVVRRLFSRTLSAL
jgi:hypothetical protein